MPNGTEWLDVVRVNAIMQAQIDVREQPPELIWSRRIPTQDATNGEILSREIRRVHISDVIAHDAKAVVYSAGKAQIESAVVPKIKHGYNLSETELLEFQTLDEKGYTAQGSQWQDYEARIIDDIRVGILQRCEQLRIAMLLDGVYYDKLGIKITGGWGMPSDLNVSPAVPWTDAANATPVNDILALQFAARTRYGIEFNRITMSTPLFQKMIATAEFQAKGRQYLAPNVSFVNINQLDLEFYKGLAVRILGVGTIELYDARYWAQGIDDATYTSTPFLPPNKVILTNTAYDGSRGTWDFANGIVIEPMIMGLVGAQPGGRLGRPTRGPYAYATAEHNPPNVTYWGCMSGFPRKKFLQANACLTAAPDIQLSVSIQQPF